MGILKMRGTGLMGVTVLALMMAGCSATRMNFDGPPGTVLTVNNKPYHLPAEVELGRPGGAGESKRYEVSVVFARPQAVDLRARGHLDVFGYNESDLDKEAQNRLIFNEADVVKLQEGTALIYKVQSVSRQPLFELKLDTK